MLKQFQQPDAIRRLTRMTDGAVPISVDERNGRIEKARKLMRDNRIDAIYIEPGSSMFYYTGMRWGTSERMFAMVIPAKGEIAWVCPKFEEERARELITMGKDIRTWEEDQSPYERMAEILSDRGSNRNDWNRGTGPLLFVRWNSPCRTGSEICECHARHGWRSNVQITC